MVGMLLLMVVLATGASASVMVVMVIASAFMVPMTVTVPSVMSPTSSTAVMVPVEVMRSVDFKPIELMLLVLEEECLIAFLNGHFRQDVNDFDQAIGVQSCIMLLTVSERSPLPVGHLFALAHFLIEQVFGYFSET